MDPFPAIDLPQAVLLADLISASVRQLRHLADASPNDPHLHPHPQHHAARTPILQIVAATAQLAALVRPPAQAVMEAATAFHLSAALRVVVEANVVEAIRERGTGVTPALHVTEISRLCSGVDPYKLARILRLLATHHIFTETAPDTFANNRLSAALDSGAPLAEIVALPAESDPSAASGERDAEQAGEEEYKNRVAQWEKKYGASAPGAGLAALIGVTTDESMLNATALADTLLHPARGLDAAHPLAAPFSRARAWQDASSAADASAGDTPRAAPGQTIYEWLSAPGHTHRLLRFGCAMKGMGAMTPESAILKGFDWRALPVGSTVVDVGGGVGAASLPIVRANPHLRLVIQDTEKVVEVAPMFWESHLPAALKEGRVSFQVQDFFAPQPARAAPPAVFLLRMIMHNWPDAEAEQILRLVRAASSNPGDGATETRLVVVDSILMYACRGGADAKVEGAEGAEGTDAGEAPEPLLANWGVANGLAYKLDMQMLSNHNAGERTLAEFTRLLARAGWRAVEVHAAHESWMPQIVAVPAPVPPPETPPSAAPAPASVEATASTESSGAQPEEDEKENEREKKAKRCSFWKGLVHGSR